LASKGSDQFVDDISDIDDLDSDDDLQWLKKLSQCLGIWGGLACNKSDKIHKNVKIIYVVVDLLGF